MKINLHSLFQILLYIPRYSCVIFKFHGVLKKHCRNVKHIAIIVSVSLNDTLSNRTSLENLSIYKGISCILFAFLSKFVFLTKKTNFKDLTLRKRKWYLTNESYKITYPQCNKISCSFYLCTIYDYRLGRYFKMKIA